MSETCQRFLICLAAFITVKVAIAEEARNNEASGSTSPLRAAPFETRCEIPSAGRLHEIVKRLDRLESQNAALIERNAELRSLLAIKRSSVGEDANLSMIAAVSDHASVSHSVAEHATQSVEPLGGDIPYLHSAIDLVNRRLSVTTVNKNFRLEFFGGAELRINLR